MNSKKTVAGAARPATSLSVKALRRSLYGMFAGGAFAFASAAIVFPVAGAEPSTPAGTPTCSAASMATAVSTVSASTSTYLANHPDTDQKFTDISKLPQDQAQQSYRAFFTANPQVETDLRAIQQPVTELSSQCGLEVTPTPVVAALQSL